MGAVVNMTPVQVHDLSQAIICVARLALE